MQTINGKTVMQTINGKTNDRVVFFFVFLERDSLIDHVTEHLGDLGAECPARTRGGVPV